jgi:hypothetical protein
MQISPFEAEMMRVLPFSNQPARPQGRLQPQVLTTPLVRVLCVLCDFICLPTNCSRGTIPLTQSPGFVFLEDVVSTFLGKILLLQHARD